MGHRGEGEGEAGGGGGWGDVGVWGIWERGTKGDGEC